MVGATARAPRRGVAGHAPPPLRSLEQVLAVCAPSQSSPHAAARATPRWGGARAPATPTTPMRRGERVAMLKVLLTLEELGPSEGGGVEQGVEHEARGSAMERDTGRLGASALIPSRRLPSGPPPRPPPQSARGDVDALLKWRKREEAKWRGALQRREEEVLASLTKV